MRVAAPEAGTNLTKAPLPRGVCVVFEIAFAVSARHPVHPVTQGAGALQTHECRGFSKHRKVRSHLGLADRERMHLLRSASLKGNLSIIDHPVRLSSVIF